ncbi:protein lin-9 homolog [Acyrthosiphon pisum]|uniref:DIRP domain-containing protein n=1 Tax=Acyrthosiphon pisum TaxID=7029 RepID=A0A8R1W4R3_ACYPI|nr:protein lin-9 homolog [Acyrthosiphon pisum]XP_003243065.1 protein lin-9 homolog [Acyrthosiphon pisum]|eukprot:XP_001949408.1 PREDICTED: protein lin-9 homolog [Acyrthosiphon pisum]
MDSDSSDMEMEDECRQTKLCPAVLGLQPVNKRNTPKIIESSNAGKDKLNRRGMPARIRKKNKLFFDEEVFNTSKNPSVKQERMMYVNSPKKQTPKKIVESKLEPKTPKTPKQEKIVNQKLQTPKVSVKTTPTIKLKTPNVKTPIKSASKKSTENGVAKPKTIKLETPKNIVSTSKPKSDSLERKRCQNVGLRLRKIFQLPKAKNWIYYEWFYSNIDKPLLYESDFMMCVQDFFPSFKIKTMTRTEWCMLRRMMGKPRRCSQNFFDEEIRELDRRRRKIRLLQQRKARDELLFKDIPDEIPLQLTVGTKVTAMLRNNTEDGLFNGTIEALDVSNNTYRINFDKPGLGTHSVLDYEVCSNQPPETISKNVLLQMCRPRIPYHNRSISPETKVDLLKTDQNTIAQYSMKLLESTVKFRKILTAKKQYVQTLRNMNSEAERMVLYNEDITPEFQSRYAKIVLDLDNLNLHLTSVMCVLSEEIKVLAPEEAETWPLITDYLQNQSFDEAEQMIEHNKEVTDSRFMSDDQPMLALIKDLLALMLQVKTLTENEPTAYELDALKRTMVEIKLKLSQSNQKSFENCVEIHMQQIQSSLDTFHTLSSSNRK